MSLPARGPQPSFPSVPPPSYPPSSTGDAERLSQAPGWRPADDDDGPDAVAWRARTGLRRADRALEAFSALNENVARLNKTIESWSDTWGRHWRTLSRIAWAVSIPLAVAALGAVVAAAWRWVSTLHH